MRLRVIKKEEFEKLSHKERKNAVLMVRGEGGRILSKKRSLISEDKGEVSQEKRSSLEKKHPA